MSGRERSDWTCSTCAWWWERGERCFCKKPEDREDVEGECRRFPPAPAPSGRDWPKTDWLDGCGEWKHEKEA